MRLSKKHGAAPILTKCYLCGEPKNELMLVGAQSDKVARAHGFDDYERMGSQPICMDKLPCEECEKHMKIGVILIGVKDDDQEYRTGHYLVVSPQFIERVIQPKELMERVLDKRVAFVPVTMLADLGLLEEDASNPPDPAFNKTEKET